MKNNVLDSETSEKTIVFTPEAWLAHWQGHRRVTRRTIEAFPEDKLFSYSIGGMRPFAQLVMEMLGMAVPGVKGVISGNWGQFEDAKLPNTKAELLNLWDKATEELNTLWPQIPAHRFQEVDVAFGQYEGPNYQTILYFIDNEIHHRGQGYVYLRSLNIEPPAFWDRQ